MNTETVWFRNPVNGKAVPATGKFIDIYRAKGYKETDEPKSIPTKQVLQNENGELRGIIEDMKADFEKQMNALKEELTAKIEALEKENAELRKRLGETPRSATKKK